MKTSMLQSHHLTIGYKKNAKEEIAICKNINFEIYKGEIICLLGRNGSGKSTLLKTLGKLIQPLSGNLKIDGSNFKDLTSIDFAKNIALVLTEALPQNTLTVYETIALGRQPYTNWLGKIKPEDKKIIETALKLTEIKDLTDKYVHQLSDGQLQRVMIARALAQDTPVILLDEPTSHLDIHHKLNIFKILKEISQQTQKTILISTHEINLALKHANRLLLIHDCQLEIGKVSDNKTQETLKNIFNSESIQFDHKSNQFLF